MALFQTPFFPSATQKLLQKICILYLTPNKYIKKTLINHLQDPNLDWQEVAKVIRQNILKESVNVLLESGEEIEVKERDFVREGLFKKKSKKSK